MVARRIDRQPLISYRLSILILLSLLLVPAHPAMGGTLPSLKVEEGAISISGVSSGAFMAHQLHVAHGADIKGIGVIAGGPYNCARSDLYRGMQVCSDFFTDYCEGIEWLCRAALTIGRDDTGAPLYQGPKTDAEAEALAEESVAEAERAFAAGHIDNPEALRDARVYLFSATGDTLVPTPVTNAVAMFYTKMGVPTDHIRTVTTVPTIHAMITDNFNDVFTGVGGRINECRETGSPFINDCRAEAPDEADVAGNLLRQIYGGLNDRVNATGHFIEFKQKTFIVDPERHGMDTDGFVYVPRNCADGRTPCKLHVALHGCRQTEDSIGDLWYTYAGYNEWAEANDIIVLYPQAQSIHFPSPDEPPHPDRHCDNLGVNPRGCWDFWGYTGPDPHVRSAPQVAAIKAMINHIAGLMGPPPGVRIDRDGSTATLNWTGLTASNLVGYNVYRSAFHPVAVSASNRVNDQPLTAPTFTDTGLEADGEYFYVVTAVAADGSETPPSRPVATETLCEFCVCWPLDAAPRCSKTFCW